MPQLFSITLKRSFVFFLCSLFAGDPDAFSQLQADFSADKAGGCSPLAVRFTNATRGASPGAVYFWELGNGNTSTLKDPGAIYTEAKAYPVKLTVTDNGSVSVKQLVVTVYKNPTADFKVAAPTVCYPAPVEFISASGPGDGFITSYTWDFGNGTAQNSSLARTSYLFTVGEVPAVNLTVTNNYGCVATITREKMAVVLEPMQPSFTYDKSLVCDVADPVLFNADATRGPGTLQFEWQLGDGTIETAKNPVHVYNKKGLFTPTLKITNEYGCQATISRPAINVAYFNTDFNSTLLCREATFTASNYSGVYATSSKWDFGDHTSGSQSTNFKKIYAEAGKYTVKLERTYNNTCREVVTREIEVLDNVNYNTTINVPAKGCINSSIGFSSSSSATPGSRLWDFGNGETNSWSASPSVTYRTPGTYTVRLTSSYGTCKEEVSRQLVIHALPDVQPFDISYGSPCGAPLTMSFKDNTPDAVSWSWQLYYNYYQDNGTSSVKDPSFNCSRSGSYSLNLTVKNAEGCSASTSRSFVVSYPPRVSVYTLKTEYAGGALSCSDIRVRLGVSSTEPVTVYSWDAGEGRTSTAKEPEFTFTKEGSYTIRFNYTLTNGCKGEVVASNVVVYKKPKADFTYQEPACSEQIAVKFTSTASPVTSYSWDFGNGYWSSSGGSPSYNFPDTGSYEIKHLVYNGGCSDRITKRIAVRNLPKLIRITAVSPQSCSGSRGEIAFSQVSSQAKGLLWDFGDGSTMPYDTSKHTITHTYTRSGNYLITLTASSGNCQLQSKAGTTILLKQKPVLSASSTSICADQPVKISVSGLETNPYTPAINPDMRPNYQYYISKLEYAYADGVPFNIYYATGFSYNNYSYQLSGLRPGILKIRAIVGSHYLSCTDTTNYVTINVNGPTAAFNIPTNNVCWKTPVALEDASSSPTTIPITSWRWNFGDGLLEDRKNNDKITHTYASPGNYQVSLTVRDGNGCSSTTSSSYAVVRGPKVAFTPTGLYVPNVPLNTTVTFINNTNTANSPGISYHWDYGNGVTGDPFTGQQTYPVAGDYTIKLTATDPFNGCTDEATSLITVRDFNTAFKFSTNYLGAGTCLPVRVDITNLSVNATSYSWDFGDGFRIEGVMSPSHVYTTPGKKVITLYSQGYNNLKGIYKDSIIIEASSAVLEADVLKGCTGQEVALRADAKDTHSYLWDFGDGTLRQTTAEPDYRHTYWLSGLFAPKVLVKDEKGCGSTAGIPEKIFIDSLRVSVSSIPEDICQYSENLFTPDIYSLADGQGEPLTYTWDYGTGNSEDGTSGRDGEFIYEEHGPHTIRLRVASPYCVKEDSRQVIVHEKFGLELIAPEQVDVCENNSVPLVVKGGYSYEWINDTEGLSDIRIGNPIAAPATDITYTVVGYDRWKCSSDTAGINVTVRPLPVINAGPDGEVLANTGFQLQATGSSDIIHWTWAPADYLSCVNCIAPVTRPKRDMQYVVTGNTRYNCIARDTVSVKAACLRGFVYIPNSFTPDRDGKNDRFYIKGKGIGVIRSMRIFNRWGDLVFERRNFDIDDPAAGWDGMYNGRPASPGSYVYFAEMKCAEDGTWIVKKGTVTIVY